MKKHLTLLILGLISAITTNAQTLPVSQNQELKKVVLEEFTAFKCGNCPAAHQAAREIGENLGEENVIVIGYHFGSLGAPGPGEPDFRTPEAAELVTFFDVVGRPKGPINRGAYGGTVFQLDPNAWATNSATIRTENADANVAMNVTINPNTREANIQAEIFYLTNSATNHYLTIGYFENDLVGPQTTYNSSWNAAYFNPDGSYNHQHVFRGFCTSREGFVVDASQTGVITELVTSTIPQDINGVPIDLNNIEFFAILHEGENTPTNSSALNGAKVSPNLVVGLNDLGVNSESILAYPNPSTGNFTLSNLDLSATITIFDVMGREIPFTQDDNQISIEESGMFIVRIESSLNSQLIRVRID